MAEDGGQEISTETERTLEDFAELSRQNQNRHQDEIFTRRCNADRSGGIMALHGIEELSPGEAQSLADFDGDTIILPDLTELSPDTAEVLIKWRGPRLSGLRQIAPEVLDQFEPEARERLIRERENSSYGAGRSCLYLDGLDELRPETAVLRADWRGTNLT